MYTWNIYIYTYLKYTYLKISIDSLEDKIDEIPRKQKRKTEMTFFFPSGVELE